MITSETSMQIYWDWQLSIRQVVGGTVGVRGHRQASEEGWNNLCGSG